MAKEANSVNHGAKEMEFGSFDSSGNGEHSGFGFVWISKTFTTRDAFIFGRKSFYGIIRCRIHYNTEK